MPRLAFIHTFSGHANRFRDLAERLLPGWSSHALADESLLIDTIARGSVSPRSVQRLAGYVLAAADAGADAVVVTCSSLGGAVDQIRPMSSVPLFRIDRGMAEAAVRRARHIGVLATLPTTLQPTAELLRQAAAEAGVHCTLSERLCEGAFSRFHAGDRAAHDEAVRQGFRDLAASTDLVVLAQASMADALDLATAAGETPFLTSPEIGMAQIAAQLTGNAAGGEGQLVTPTQEAVTG